MNIVKLILFIVVHGASISLLAISSYVLGRRLTRDVCYASTAEAISFSTALGLGVYAYLVLTLGLLRLLYPWVTLAALLVLQALSYWAWLDLWRRAASLFANRRRAKKLLAGTAVLAVVLAPCFLWSLFPPTAFDSIMYHLPYAKIYLQNHQLVFTPYLRYPVSPQTNEMLFTLMLLFRSDVAAQLVQFLMMVLVGSVLFSWGTRVFSRRTGLWAAAVWLATPLVLSLGSSAYIDIGLTLFVILGAFAICNWIFDKSERWLVLAAVFSGFAAGSKYSALFFLAVYALIALRISIRDRRLVHLITFTGIACCVAAPWYLRNLYLTGNPLFPFLPSLFGYSTWSAEDLGFQFIAWVNGGVRGRSPDFYRDGLLLGFPLLIVMPMVIPWAIRHPRIRILLAFALTYIVFWLLTASLPRYLLPVWPVLALVTAATMDYLFSRSFSRWRTKSWIAVLMALLLIFPGWLFAAIKVYRRWPLPDTPRSRDAYLAQQLVSYPAYKFLNELKGTHYRLYALYDTNMAYYADGLFMGDWFGPARYRDIVAGMQNGETLLKALRSLQADYLLVPTNNRLFTLPDDDYFRNHFKLIYATPDVMVFELS